ncbi:ABC-2 family transporter protein [Xylocopilactobacillus apis]|uniref:Membrane protein n=1 Tax=Xylocopilactobacillus apis TaxID=2932183 RepID=A0AAU9CYG2_9LACO|nr:ABC-2 family transporter protein [Xylocopilactobacillus apis]BDR56278.1 membrane protein [Xylocopilactobacillus apis]
MNLKILKSAWKLSFQEFLVYKTTSILTFILAALFFSIEIIVGMIYFSVESNLNGWTRSDYLLLISSITTITYIYNIFFIVGHENLSEDILEGNLDYLFLRPVSSYWYSALSHLDIPSCFNLVISGVMSVSIIISKRFNWVEILLYLLTIFLGTCFVFLMNQIAVTFSFWFEGFTALGGIVENTINLLSRPLSIFPQIIQTIFTYIFPVLLVTNMPVIIFKGKHNYYLLIYLLIYNLLMYVLSRKLWTLGVKRYSSAN